MKEERSNININIGIERSFIVDERREEVLLKFKFYLIISILPTTGVLYIYYTA